MATGELPPDHSALDLLPQRASTCYFRRLLIKAGVLPPIHVFQHELTMHFAALAAKLERPTGNKPRRFYGGDLRIVGITGQVGHIAETESPWVSFLSGSLSGGRGLG